MKRILFCLFLTLGFSQATIAQITKSDIEKIMADIGTSPENIKELFVGNTMTYYKNGDKKETYSKYLAEKGNKVELTEAGIRLNWFQDGEMKSVLYIPYSSIITIDIGVEYITLYVLR